MFTSEKWKDFTKKGTLELNAGSRILQKREKLEAPLERQSATDCYQTGYKYDHKEANAWDLISQLVRQCQHESCGLDEGDDQGDDVGGRGREEDEEEGRQQQQ